MNHRHRLICGFAVVGLAVWMLMVGRGSAAFAGVGFALLLCPLVMGGVMWLLMRQPRPTSSVNADDPHDSHTTVGRQ